MFLDRQKEVNIIKYNNLRRKAVFSIKIAIGSCVPIILAEWFHLEFASSAGIITLLSIFSTKWATLKLCVIRILSFFMSVMYAWIIFTHVSSGWLTYGLFVLLLVGTSYFIGWKDTISVNAVIGTHFWTTNAFGIEHLLNELYLVLIGSTAAIVLNLIHDNPSQKKRLIYDMRYIESQLQEILLRLSDYLLQKEQQKNVWEDIVQLKNYLSDSMKRAYEYQENTFASHPSYYIYYMEMRIKQCNVLYNLHSHMKKIRTMPKQARPIASYITYMKQFIIEMNIPKQQIQELHKIANNFRIEELPKTREEFEGRAILYHIMMDLEEFLIFKKNFIDSLTEEQKKIYWKNILK